MQLAPPSKIKRYLKYLPYLPKTIWFNFHYLPYRQAVKLPIILYKPKLKKCKGKVQIDAPIKSGMICLGVPIVSIYPNAGISWEHRGTIRFQGKCIIGNNSYISTGASSTLNIGHNFNATTTLKLVCYHAISFGQDVLIGWDNLFCDTDFHACVKMDGEKSRGYAPIKIGNNNWFAMKCMTLKNTHTPDFCIVGAGSLLIKDYSAYPKHCLIAGQPAVFIKAGIYRDPENDTIEYK